MIYGLQRTIQQEFGDNVYYCYSVKDSDELIGQTYLEDNNIHAPKEFNIINDDDGIVSTIYIEDVVMGIRLGYVISNLTGDIIDMHIDNDGVHKFLMRFHPYSFE